MEIRIDEHYLFMAAVVVLLLAAVTPPIFFVWLVLTATPKRVHEALDRLGRK